MKLPDKLSGACVILGGGGHAKMLIEAILATEPNATLAVLDADERSWGRWLLGAPIFGGDALLPELVKRGATHFSVGLGSTGDTNPRRKLFNFGIAQGLKARSIVHPSAVCSPYAQLRAGVQLLPRSIVNVSAVLKENVIVNSGAIVEHDCTIGEHTHIATGAHLAGGVRVGSGVHIGIGATIREKIEIGDGAIIGAGAVVVKNVSPHTVVAGVPARPLRKAQAAIGSQSHQGSASDKSGDVR